MENNENKQMKLLALGSHPDDIEYGCGGTLFRLSQAGYTVYLMIMTEGTMGGQGHIRRREQMNSAKLRGTERVFWGDYEDTKLPLDRPLIRKLEDVIDEVEPSSIFVHAPHDTHQDHRNLSQATISATRYIKNVLFYEGPTTSDFSPSVFVDIGDALENKLDLLRAHESQVMRINVADLTIVDGAISNAMFRGIQGRVKYAEGFMPLRYFIDISGMKA